MTAQELVVKLQGLKVRLTLEEDRVRVITPGPGVMSEELWGELARNKEEIRELLQQARQERRARAPMERAGREGKIPLSYAQQRLWFLGQMEGGSEAYHIPCAVRLRGKLEREALKRALGRIVERHEALRTTFVMADGEAEQRIVPVEESRFELREHDLREHEDAQEELKGWIGEEAGARFDLAAGPLIRGRLIQVGEEEHVLLITMHHIVSDGWSLGLLFKELSILYGAYVKGEEDALPELAVQYADYAVWQRKWVEGEVLRQQGEYWKKNLAGAPELLELPADHARPRRQDHSGATLPVMLPEKLTAGLKELSGRQGTTLYMTLLAGWAVLLGRLAGQQDVVIGTPVANRGRMEIERLIGFFVNTLVLRVDVSGHPTVGEVLERVKRQSLAGQQHQEIPFEQVVELVQPVRSLAHSPLFQVVFTWQGTGKGSFKLSGLEAETLDSPYVVAKFDLSLALQEAEGRIAGSVEYARALFERETVERYVGYYVALLEGMARGGAGQPADALRMLGEEEERQLTREWNEAEKIGAESCLHELFEEQARRRPEAVAVEFGEEKLSYGELNERGDELAEELREMGVRGEDRVAVCVERGLEMMVAVLGILKAGAGYVPVDPGYPRERVEYMLEDSEPAAVVTDNRNEKIFRGEGQGRRVLNIEKRGEWAREGKDAKRGSRGRVRVEPENLAYVIYTSGSTGKPKGVMVEHRNVVRLFGATERWFGFNEEDVWTLFHSSAFDFSVWEIWGALLYGGRLVVISREMARAPEDFYGLVCAGGVTVLNQTPSAFQRVLEAQGRTGRGDCLRYVIFGGEALQVGSLRPWYEQSGGVETQLVNMYGITETTVHVTYRELERKDAEKGEGSPIGRRICDLRMYVLGSGGEAVPVGVVGEMYVGGAGVARGYLKRMELTGERFLPDEKGEDGGRVYRTGDLGKWGRDGQIEFLGRNDQQVKLRGYRIELGEIEARLREYEGIREAVVVAREEGGGEKRLVAYYTVEEGTETGEEGESNGNKGTEEGGIGAEELRKHLGGSLPEYMVPGAYVRMERMPLTGNGKLDRKRLPAPEGDAYAAKRYEEPEGEMEKAIAGVWAEVLKVERVGRQDNFFNLGGHSLLAVKVVERMRQRGYAVDVRGMFATATVAEWAAMIRGEEEEDEVVVPENRIPRGCAQIRPEMLPLVELTEEEIGRIVRNVPGGAENVQDIYPLAPLQEGIFFHYLLGGEGDPYVVAMQLRFSSREDVETYVRALRWVIQRHDILRTAVMWEGLREAVQVVWRKAELVVEEVEVEQEGREGEVGEAMYERYNLRRFRMDLRQAPLLRVYISEEKKTGRWVMMLLVHHLVGDHVTLEVMQQEMKAYLLKQEERLAKPEPFRNLVAQARLGVSRQEHEEFFRKMLGDVEEPNAAFGLREAQGTGGEIEEAGIMLEPELVLRVRERARKLGVSAASICHVAWASVLGMGSGREDVVFGTVLMGRMLGREQASAAMGMFINTLPVRLRVGGEGVESRVREMHQVLGELMRHEHASLALAQRCSRVVAPKPLFSALINYRHTEATREEKVEKRKVREGMEWVRVEERSNYPLALSVDDLGEEEMGLAAQAPGRIGAGRICGYMRKALELVVEALASDPGREMRELKVLPEEELRRRLEEWHGAELGEREKSGRHAGERDKEREKVRAYEAPEGEMEKAVAEIWAEVLQVERVGRQDNFFELGGQSLTAVQVMLRVMQVLGVEVELKDLFARPALRDFVRGMEGAKQGRLPEIERVERGEKIPLSFAQQRLWFLAQMEGVSEAYHIPLGVRLRGELNREALVRALGRIVERHEALRTTFVIVDGEAEQRIAPIEESGFELREHDLRECEDPQEELKRIVIEEAGTRFDLEAGPLLRGRLIREDEEEHVLLITMHHIVSDGWSLGVLFEELGVLYGAYVRGEEDPLPELAVQYADYVVWQRRWMEGEVLEQQAEYWRENLLGAPEVLEVPRDHVRPAQQDYSGATLPVVLPEKLTAGLKELSSRQGTTLYMTLLAGWAVLLGRLSGQQDVVIGTPVANRGRMEIERLIGFFVNTLVLRVDVSGRPTVGEVLERVKKQAVGGQQHQEIPFEQVVELVQPVRSLAHSPVFQVVFSWQDAGGSRMELPGLEIEPLSTGRPVCVFDLILSLRESGDCITGGLSYASALFAGGTIERYAEYLVRLLEGMVGAGESGLVDGLEILGEEERRQVLYGWNQTERALPAVGCVHELFEEQVKRAPEAVAVVSEDRALSYGELNRRANQLAHYLRELGVRPDVCVGICAERGLEMIAGMLAIMKAGGAYVPLDPAYPTERLRYMLQDSAPAVLLTQGESGGWWRDINGAMPVVNLGPGVGAWNSYPESNPKVDSVGVTARHVAYVIYTSGSTGQPKGVCVEHRGIVRLVRNTNYIQIGPEDAIAQASNVSFDAAIFEIWSALSNGARMVNIGRNVLLSPVQLEQELQRNQVTILLLTTALFNQMARDGVEMFSQLRYLLFGGEQVEPRSVTRVLLEGMPEHLLHMYGPSETVTFATWEEVTRVEAERTIPIGRPIANTRAYIVDGSGEPVPVGVVGELCIGGIGVARGYLKQPELTAERFVEDPYAEEAGARMYKTGDLARWRADGSIEFIGRNDEQVKIRGFRIELGEIESKLAEHAGVRDVLVVVRPGAESEKYLVAYYVAGEDQNNEGTVGSEALRRYLAERLPEYMVPSAYVMLEKIPLTANGKVDRKALPVPGMGAYAAKSYEPPQGEVETKLAQLWAEVLQLEQVGRHDNFFERGGHSLLVVRFMMRVRQELGVEMAIEEMFARPVLADLARHLEKAVEEVGGRLGQARRPVERMVRPAEIPLSFAQQRLWFLNQMEGSSASYNIPVALGLKGELNSRALEAALGDLLQRHESLRTVFPERMGIPRQHILDARATGFRLEIVLSSAAGMREDVAAAAATTFDLSREISLRAYLFVLSPRENVLLLLLHHIAADLWSTAPLWRDLDVAYRARSQGRAPEWSDLPVQYADYALWQREVLGSEEDPESVIAQQVAYWKETLKDLPEQIELPVDRVRPAIASYRGGGVQIHVSEATHAGLLQLAGQEQATLFMVLQAGLVALLSRLGAGTDIALGSPIAGRPDIALEELVGFFINTLVLRTEAGGNPTLVELLGRVRRADLSAYAHQDVPFERLVEQLNPVRSLSRQPLFQVMFTILASEYGEVKLGELEVRSEGVSTTTAKFDLLFGLWEVRGSNGEPQGLAGNIEYAMDLFEHGTVERIGKQLVRVLEAMAENPGQRIGKIDLLEESERRQLLWEWNETKHAEGMRTAVERFEEQVERGPMAIAVRCGGEAVSYGELNERANRVAHLLLGRGVGIDDVVGVALPRSVAMVTALLGVLKSGAGYLPLDIEYPEERLRYVVEETKPEGIITSVEAGKKLPGERKQIVLDATGTQAELAGSPTHNPARRPGEDHLSHVIYTSGSTGRPKGVAVRHGSVSVLLDWMKEEYSGRELSVVLASTAISFDISVFEIFGTLSCGGTIVLVNNALEGSEEIIEAGVTLINTVPSVMNALLERKGVPGSVLTVNLAGEALHTRMVRRLYEETGVERVLNLYGPSEDTTFSTVALISRQEEREDAPIGKPLWNTQVYVLDGEMEATPRGVVGELYIGGAGLARGYEKRGELTGERFVPNPYGEMGSRLYRTGDLVKWREDGNLEFVGRRDEQVKIRGLRVELGEIEAALLRDEKVGQAVAMVREDRPGERRLVGYVVARPGEKVEKEELRRGLGKSLPEYMVPGVLVELDEMPFTANGKVNRRGLPAPEVKAREWREPKTAQEQMLCSLIAATLGTGRVGLDDNFFELGGDSIKSIQLVSRARNLGVMLTPRDVFRYATIEQLAAAIESYEGEQLPTVIRDLSKEAVLDPKIVPVSQAPAARSAAGILLTGASGFLGCFLLVELLNRTQATVYCLVRSSTREEGMARIVAKLKSYGLWQETFLSRIVAVPGDMAKTMLDLSRQQFEKLAEAIDAIYHCAAMVNVVYSYDIMKATNVRGTEEILRLACLGRTKPLHYISTLSVIPPLSETEQAESMTEEELFEKWQNLPSGYTQSKWVAEKLVRIARSRGVPVSIYRPSFISGSMQSGMTNPNDFVSRFISACLELGCVPDADMEINMTPVDHISRAIVALSMREDMQGRCLNVVNAKPVRLSMLSECLLSLGHPSGLPMQKVSYSSWWSQCVASAELKDLRNFFPEPVRKPVPKGRVNTTEVKIDFDSAARLLQEDGIHFPAMTPELLKSYITYLRRDVVRKQKLVFERASAD